MEVSIVKIGNSRGFRLSKTLLEKYQIKDKVELILLFMKMWSEWVHMKVRSRPRNLTVNFDQNLTEIRQDIR